MMRKVIRPLREVISLAIIFAILLVFAFPFLWIIVTSLRTESTLFTTVFQLFPEAPSLASYRELLSSDFPRFILNSLIVCLPATLIAVVLALLAAYAFSRRNFAGKGGLLVVIIFSQLFPFVVLVTPLYTIFFRLNLVNSFLGLIFVYIAITLPFAIYMLIGYLDTVPKALDESAIIDGCSIVGVIFRVILPVAWPGLAATAIYAFAQAWNEYIFALAFLTDNSLKTVPVGLASYFGEFSTRWDLVMTASVVATVPTLIFFLFAQRQLVAGLAAGSVKQ